MASTFLNAARYLAAAVASSPNVALCASPDALPPEVRAALSSGPIEYTAVPYDEGGLYFEIISASDRADIIDQYVLEETDEAVMETSRFLEQSELLAKELGLLEDAQQDQLRRIKSRVLVYEALRAVDVPPEHEWVGTGLTLGFSPDVNELANVAGAASDWSNGTVILTATNQTPERLLAKAQYSESTLAGLSIGRMRELAKEATNQMFLQAAETTCDSFPRPREITPGVSISFNFFAAAEFSITGTFDVPELCEILEAQRE